MMLFGGSVQQNLGDGSTAEWNMGPCQRVNDGDPVLPEDLKLPLLSIFSLSSGGLLEK